MGSRGNPAAHFSYSKGEKNLHYHNEKYGITLYCGKCEDIAPQFDANSIDTIITDPPYGTTACSWDSIISFEEMWSFINKVKKDNSPIILTASQPFTSSLIASNYSQFKCCWTWVKTNCGNYMMAKYVPLKYTEDIIVFSDGGTNTNCTIPMKYNPQGLRRIDKNIKSIPVKAEGINRYNRLDQARVQKFTNYPKNILYFDSVKTPVHPTQKPTTLMDYLVNTYSDLGDTILDFTMGSGTTGVACINTGRKFIGIEMDEKYFKIAVKRIETAIEEVELDMFR